MPKPPPDFDPLDPLAVLRLRFRDWMWPAAVAVAVAIPLLQRWNAPYQAGSVSFYANVVLGPWILLAASLFAGLRWCWIGRIGRRAADLCGRCGYPLDRLAAASGPPRCPECGTVASARTTGRRIPFREIPPLRLLLDVPGVLAILFPLLIVGLLMLVVTGVITID
jgi:hypothetical protein